VWTVDEDLDAVIVGPEKSAIDEEPEIVEKPSAVEHAVETPSTTEKAPQLARVGPSPPTADQIPSRSNSPAPPPDDGSPEMKRAQEAVLTANPVSYTPEYYPPGPQQPEEKKEVPLPTTSTLPGVTGTADQAPVATTEAIKEPEAPERPKPENPTAISGAQHPEDAEVPREPEPKGGERPVGMAEEELDDGFEKVERIGEIPEEEKVGGKESEKMVLEAADGGNLGERIEREG
jgi:hypothetical protein